MRKVKAEYLRADLYETIFHEMNDANADACRVALATGLRIGDVLSLKTCDINGDKIAFYAQKTRKNGEISANSATIALLRKHTIAHNPYCFPGTKIGTHRTRQAVWADMRKACKLLGVDLHVSPHSCRKTYAVDLFHKQGIEAVKEKLQHDNVSTTLLYAFADCNMQNPDERIQKIAREVAAEIITEAKVEIINEIRTLFGLAPRG